MTLVIRFGALSVAIAYLTRSVAHVISFISARPGEFWLMAFIVTTIVGAANGQPLAAFILFIPAFMASRIGGIVRRGGLHPRAPQGFSANLRQSPLDADPETLDQAWQLALTLDGSNVILLPARSRCRALLRAHRTLPLESGLLEWAVFIETRVPEIVEACAIAMEMESRSDRRMALRRDLEAALQAIGLEAERRQKEVAEACQRTFEICRRHVEKRTRGVAGETSQLEISRP